MSRRLGFHSVSLSLALAVLAGCSSPLATIGAQTPGAATSTAGAPAEAAGQPAPTTPDAGAQPAAPTAATTLAGEARFRGEPLTNAAVKLLDAETGAVLTAAPQVTGADGRFELAVPSGVTWVRVLVTTGQATLSTLAPVGAEAHVLATTGATLRIDETSTALAQMAMGAFLLYSPLPAAEVAKARQTLLGQLAAHAKAIEAAFKAMPALANQVVEDADAQTGLPRKGAVERVAQAAGAYPTLQQVAREAVQAVAAAIANAGAAPSKLADTAFFYAGPNLSLGVTGGKFSVQGPRGEALELTPGRPVAPALLQTLQNGSFFVAKSHSKNTAPDPVITFSPSNGPVGTAITITGTGFDAATPANNVVTVNGTPATVVSATATQLVVTAPDGTGGLVAVSVGGEQVESATSFGTWAPISAGTSSYTWNYNGGDAFSGGNTVIGANGSGFALRDLGATYMLTQIDVAQAYSDYNLGLCSSIVFEVQHADGTWQTVDTLNNANITPDQAAKDIGMSSQDSYQFVFDTPVEAKAFRLTLNGNGWFVVENCRLRGFKLDTVN